MEKSHHPDHAAGGDDFPSSWDEFAGGIEVIPFPTTFKHQHLGTLCGQDCLGYHHDHDDDIGLLYDHDHPANPAYQSTLPAAESHEAEETVLDDDPHEQLLQSAPVPNAPLSVEDLIRMAALKFIQSHSNDMPFDVAAASVESPLTEEQSQSVELAQLLLEAVEKVGDRKFDTARTLLQQCDRQASPTGNPVQRLVFYYSRGLRDRIDRETGGRESAGKAKAKDKEQSSNLLKVIMTPSVRSVEFQRRFPFSQVAQFAGIQTIVEHVEGVRKIHVLDLAIRNGHQWTILIQALASRRRCRVEHLRITAVATMGKELIEQTGKRLVSFAQTMNLVCSFDAVMVRDLAELRQDHLQFGLGETVVVLADYVASMLTSPAERLDSVVKVIRRVKPCIMVVMEMEGNRNSQVFVNRFVESFFFASVLFDCMGECMGSDEATRRYGEETLLGEVSKIVIGRNGGGGGGGGDDGEGNNREWMIRSLKVDVWRAYFRRFGMVETQLSCSSMYQAELVAKRVPCWSPCTVWMDGKSLIVGWKGTPVKSVTAWKFS